jgi:serine/threonine protein kinase
VDDVEQDFIVMEYADERPLDKTTPTGGLPIDEALSYAAEIASALQRPNIVHRNLKPSKVPPQTLEYVKGLALRMGEKRSSWELLLS